MTTTTTLEASAIRAQAARVLHTARAADRPFRDDDDLAVVWQADRGFFTNMAVVLAAPSDWHDVLARIEETVPPGRPAILVSPFAAPDLSAQGWGLVGHPPFMVRPAGPPPASVRTPAELTITAVADQPSLEVFERTLVEGYPEPAMQPYRYGDFFTAPALGGPLHCFTGFVAGAPVATASGYVDCGVNLVEMISTLAGSRGRGYGEALTWSATLVDPSLPAALFASDLGRPVYERMGYQPVSRWTLWHRPSSSSS